jgi:hypothetical protein
MRRAILSKMSPPEMLTFLRQFREWNGDGGPRRLKDVFRATAPALEVLAQLYAARSFNITRKFVRQDFFDIEHAGLAPVYADAFVTADRGLRDLLPPPDRRPPDARATILASVTGVIWLDRSSASPRPAPQSRRVSRSWVSGLDARRAATVDHWVRPIACGSERPAER